MFRPYVVSAIALLSAFSPIATGANNWSQFKYDETHPGSAPASSNTEFGAFKASWWKGVAVSTNPGSIAVREGLVYLGDSSGKVYAFDQESGGLVWSNTTATGQRIVGAPAVGQNLVYVLTDGGTVYMFDRKTGQLMSTVSTGPTESSPVLSETGGLFIVATTSGVSGYLLGSKGIIQTTPKWTFSVSGNFFNNTVDCSASPNTVTTPLVYADSSRTQVLFGSVNKCFFSIDAGSVGTISVPLWAFKAKESIRSPPGVDATTGKVVFGDQGGNVYILSIAQAGAVTGTPAYTEPTTGKINEIVASPVLASGKILVGSRNGNLRLLSATGVPQQVRDLGGQIVATPAVAHDHILAGSFDGNMYLLKMEDLKDAHEPIRTTGQVESSPAISGTQGFWAANDGALYSYGGSKPERADLAVQGLSASGLVAGRPGTVTATIKNVGVLASDKAVAKLFAGGASAGESDIPALEPGATYAFGAGINPAASGSLSIRLFADATRVVKEADESNNDVTISAAVEEPPPTDSVDAPASSGEQGVPGFQAAFVALALVGAAALARRRRE